MPKRTQKAINNNMSKKKTTPINEDKQYKLFPFNDDNDKEVIETQAKEPEQTIRVIELFAGVGGFRIGLENASKDSNIKFKTIWSNQWEPATRSQEASDIYCREFKIDKEKELTDPTDNLPYYEHVNEDINSVAMDNIPQHDMLVGGFPCQDYSVAATLNRSGGIEGKKGVLWWSIYNILKNHRSKPKYLFLENVDRLLVSPAKQRGRDFAIILASLAEQGYVVEWRVINAGDYGKQQRRRRTYIVAYRQDTAIANRAENTNPIQWITEEGTFATEFPVGTELAEVNVFDLQNDIREVSVNFNAEKANAASPFKNAGIMAKGHVFTAKTVPAYQGPHITLADIVLPEDQVPAEYFIMENDLKQWKYLKGSKREQRTTKTGHVYFYSEGGMSFPDPLDMPSRTIITGEGGKSPSRFKHVIEQSPNRFRRLTPIELERLDGFPDNHTNGVSDIKRAFLMGNALVIPIVEMIGRGLIKQIKKSDKQS